MKCFAKIVKIYNYFSKVLYRRSLISFGMRPSLDKYSLNCRKTSRNVLYETYSEPCRIQNPFILRTQDIFRALSRHILAYSKCCVTLPHWEHCHIQNFIPVYLGIFRHIQAYSNYSTSVVPRRIFVPLNRYGRPKIEPKFFRARFVKRPQTRLGIAF